MASARWGLHKHSTLTTGASYAPVASLPATSHWLPGTNVYPPTIRTIPSKSELLLTEVDIISKKTRETTWQNPTKKIGNNDEQRTITISKAFYIGLMWSLLVLPIYCSRDRLHSRRDTYVAIEQSFNCQNIFTVILPPPIKNQVYSNYYTTY